MGTNKISWRDVVVTPETSIEETLMVMDRGALRLALVCDAEGKLKGTVTDGDVRRALIAKRDLDQPVAAIMNGRPHSVPSDASREAVMALMQRLGLLQMPVVDGAGRLVDLKLYRDLAAPPPRDNWVFLMAGGMGTRLRPLTEECPKPMLPVGGRPLLQHILESFIAAGFHRFYISVHYLADMIKRHFGDGERWGVTLRYVEEDQPLGTAGALGLLPEINGLPILMMNGDLLTRVDFADFLDFHEAQGAEITIGVREYEMQVPFGVIRSEGQSVVGIVEKPVQRYFVNAGMYVIAPRLVRSVAAGERLDMPDLIQRRLDAKEHVAMYPIHEYWLDIGRPDDFVRAQLDYSA